MNAGTLTVKHVEKSGHEGITMCTSVCYQPHVPNGENEQGYHKELVAFGVPAPVSDGCNRYSDGIVYVMNEAGATVAKYDLD